MDILLSIALVTRNRSDSLERTLYSLSKQSYQPFEVIVSDDSDEKTALLENKKLAEKFGCRYISGPQKGLYANRNFVAKNCNGTHIRTMDDDHEFPEDHIKICLAAIITDINAIWTIGEYFPSDLEMSIPAPIPGQLHPRGYSYIPENMNNYYGISCGASIYPKKIIDCNILNVELFKFGIVYLEYGVRLFKKKFVIKHLPDTYVIHHYDENTRSVSSLKVINSALIFSILMLSFYHNKSIKNQFLTTMEIIKGILSKKYSFKLVYDVFLMYNKYKYKYS